MRGEGYKIILRKKIIFQHCALCHTADDPEPLPHLSCTVQRLGGYCIIPCTAIIVVMEYSFPPNKRTHRSSSQQGYIDIIWKMPTPQTYEATYNVVVLCHARCCTPAGRGHQGKRVYATDKIFLKGVNYHSLLNNTLQCIHSLMTTSPGKALFAKTTKSSYICC